MITVKKAGMLTTIQDLGRYGYQKYGVIVSGVMDNLAHRIANLLVGNEESLPTIEMTLVGPTFEFEQDTLIAICGGDFSASINGKQVGLWRPIFVKRYSVLNFGPTYTGCRAYLAVAGGLMIDDVMKSKSTYLRAGVGGFNGRGLKSGDILKIGQCGELSIKISRSLRNLEKRGYAEANWKAKPVRLTQNQPVKVIRVIKGRQFHLFTKKSQDDFLKNAFVITNQSDRMGYRLKGTELQLAREQEMISEAVDFGTIQVPPDGHPIILMADRQTTGGYPKIGQVVSVDLPIIAQAKPGDKLTFTEITLEEAQQLYLDREQAIEELKTGISLKFN